MKKFFITQLIENIPIKTIMPMVLTVVLFVVTIFLLIIPCMEAKLLEGKKELIRELTESVWSALSFYEEKEEKGFLTRQEAQEMAIEHIRKLRYGPELKDYFWINDMHPYLIMHPYRSDLNGQDISTFTDPNGKYLFVEFVKVVKKYGSGYVDYKWQWQDDQKKIVPKISFVKGFAPWKWIIGTGIYVEDVHTEINSITRELSIAITGILTLIMILSSYITWNSIIVEKEKKKAEEKAMQNQEQLFQADKLASLGTLVSGVAHEINNPITSIMLNIPILGKIWERILPILDENCKKNGDFNISGMKYSELRDRMPTLLLNVSEGINRVKTIVRDLKEFARINPSELIDDVDINHVVKKSLRLVSNLIRKITDNFNVSYGDHLPMIKGNSQRIEQVIINLLVNACQALSDKQNELSIHTSHDIDSARVLIEIKDQGVGIPLDMIHRVKDPFFTTKKDSGTGLGLAISDRIIRDHSGTMETISSLGNGTLIKIFIPCGSKPIE